MLTSAKYVVTKLYSMMQFTESADFIGRSKFLPWRQLNGCSVTRPFLSMKGVACETKLNPSAFAADS